jgi:hypothetical protein
MEVLNTFWRRNVEAPSRIREAALQYGPVAVGCLMAITVELAIVIAASISRAHVIGVIAIVCEALNVLSLSWAIVRTRDIRRLTI